MRLGLSIERWDGDTLAMLAALRPRTILITELGFDNPRLEHIQRCVLRDTRFSVRTDPRDAARMLAEHARRLRNAFPHVELVLHGLNENMSAEAAAWELAFVEEAHRQGFRTVCCNGAYGNDPKEWHRAVAERSDYVGWHLYEALTLDGELLDARWTSLRYRSWPAWWPRHRHLPTEVGFDIFLRPGESWTSEDRPGWRLLAPDRAAELTTRLASTLQEWTRDGLQDAIYFTAPRVDPSWWAYTPTLEMLKVWGAVPEPIVTPSPSSIAGGTVMWSPNRPGRPRTRTLGVIVHSTRSGRTGPGAWEAEFELTRRYMLNPASAVSAHAIIGFEEGQYVQLVPWEEIAWHAREHNAEWIGIELTQPTPDDPYSEWQYLKLRQLLEYLSQQFGFPLDREHVVGHDETPQGKRDGKTDPGAMFDWSKAFPKASDPPPANEEARQLIGAIRGLLDQLEGLL